MRGESTGVGTGVVAVLVCAPSCLSCAHTFCPNCCRLQLILLSMPFLSTAAVWTLTNVSHSLVRQPRHNGSLIGPCAGSPAVCPHRNLSPHTCTKSSSSRTHSGRIHPSPFWAHAPVPILGACTRPHSGRIHPSPFWAHAPVPILGACTRPHSGRMHPSPLHRNMGACRSLPRRRCGCTIPLLEHFRHRVLNVPHKV